MEHGARPEAGVDGEGPAGPVVAGEVGHEVKAARIWSVGRVTRWGRSGSEGMGGGYII